MIGIGESPSRRTNSLGPKHGISQRGFNADLKTPKPPTENFEVGEEISLDLEVNLDQSSVF